MNITYSGGCLCNFEDQQGGSLEFKEVCIAGVLEDRLPCTCSLNNCQVSTMVTAVMRIHTMV